VTSAVLKRTLLFALQCLVTIGILAWVFHDSDRRAAIWRALHQANPAWILAGVLVSGVGEAATMMRWAICLRVLGVPIGWGRVTRLFFIGQFFNLFVFGATGGDVAKAYYVCIDTGCAKTPAILSVLMDRLISLVILIGAAAALILWRYDYLSQTPITTGLLYFLIIFMTCAAVVIISGALVTGFHLAHKLPAHLPGREHLIRVSTACNLFGHAWRQTLGAIAVSVVSLLAFFGTYYCAARAFDANASLLDILSIMPVVTVITALPISVNGVGVRETLFQRLLGDLSGVPAGIAILVSLTGFLFFVGWSLVGGVIYVTHRRPLPRDLGAIDMADTQPPVTP
jgi:glycosyltransferase 2 family protein